MLERVTCARRDVAAAFIAGREATSTNFCSDNDPYRNFPRAFDKREQISDLIDDIRHPNSIAQNARRARISLVEVIRSASSESDRAPTRFEHLNWSDPHKLLISPIKYKLPRAESAYQTHMVHSIECPELHRQEHRPDYARSEPRSE